MDLNKFSIDNYKLAIDNRQFNLLSPDWIGAYKLYLLLSLSIAYCLLLSSHCFEPGWGLTGSLAMALGINNAFF